MRRLKQALSLLLSLIMVLGMFTVIPFTASAEGTADVTVGTWDDLQDALDDNDNQGKTIGLSGPLDGSGEDTLTLNGSGKSMTIDLAGFEVDMKRTSKGDNKHVFEAKGGATLTIKDTVGTGAIKGGWANNGGGIYVNEDSKVILDGVTVSNNKAGTDGGAVYVKGILEMTNCTLTQNSAGDTGGAIYVTTDGSFTLTDSVITQNNATKTGGGINMHLKSDSTISGCQITYNTAGSYGGGIRMDAQDKTLTINSSTLNSTLIDHNTASDDGGGIYLHYGTINMTGGSISNNKSNKDGGGVKVTPRTAFTANGVIINENVARDEEGGGVKNQGTTTLTSCTISKNSAKKQGGGIFNDEYDGSEGDVTLENCTVSLNTSDSTGGGVYSDKLLKLKGGTFTQNTAGDGKGCGIFIGKDSDPTQIEGGLIVDGNSSSTKGQELLLRPGKTITVTGALTNGAKIGVTMDDGIGTFTTGYNTYNNGTAPSTYFYSPDGFGVDVDEDGEVQLMTSWPDLQTEINASTADEPIVLNHNYTAASNHDRLMIDGNRTVTIDLNGKTLNRNLTSEKTNGHVIEVFGGSTLIIKDSSTDKTGTITGGYSARGGGIYVNKDATLKVESGTISGNNADCDGGGIYVAGDLIMSGGVITENMAYDSGGAIYVSSDGKMNLENVQITRNIGEDIGGAINIHMRADSTIKKCTITGNEATDDVGGGIHMNAKGRKLTITDSNIDNNSSADDGAGIYIKWGTVEMSGGSIKGNHTLGDGAGVKVTPTTTFIADDVDICNNTSEEEQGGGVKNQGTTTLKNCTITGNSAADTGGGVFNDATDGSAGDLTIESCTIAGNSADKGGGIYTDEKLTLKGSNVIGAATVNGESVPGNSASNKGGGICINGGAIFTKLQGSLVMTGNTAALGNDLYIEKDNKFELTGAITGTNIGYVDMSKPGRFTKNYSTYHSTTDPSTFFGTNAGAIPVIWSPDDENKEAYLKSNWPELQKKINNAENGGTVELDTNYTAGSADFNLSIPENKTVTIDLKGYTINRNITSLPFSGVIMKSFGSAIVVQNDAKLTIKDSSADGSGTITGGYSWMGGGIFINFGATCTIEGGTIKGNKASIDGGGIYVMGTLNMTGGTISDNNAGDTGGGIYVYDGGKISLSNVSITDNEADNTGGGINMHLGANTTFSNCTISDNTAGDVGGGLRMDAKDKKLTITNTNIENNNSNDDGAGIFLQYGTIEMTGGKISGNTSGNDGGGVKVTPKTKFMATNVTISNNTSSTEQGGGIKNQGTTELANCTVKNNSAKENGGGIFNDCDNGSAGKLTLDSCTITNNKSSANGGGVYSDEVLTIKGSTTITDNFASDKGGGIFVGKGSDDDTKIEGALVIKDNKATTFGNDLFLNTGKNDFFNTGIKLYVTGALTGSTIKVDTDVGTGTLTKDYSKYNSDAPSSFFVPTKGYDVVLKDGEAVITSGWSTLKKNIENYTGTEPFKLDGDYTASQSDKKIEIKSGKNITIDLNGHTLNRNRMSSGDNGHVFEVFGTLTVTDSKGGGKITGGWAKRGGGVNVSSDGTFILEGGTITGNRAGDHGGGVYVHGTFIMRGGKIEKNRSEETGGGIELDKNSTLSLEGGSITDNEAIGEQIDTDEDDQTNKSEGRGGAVMSDKDVNISIKGNPVIKNNRASLTGSDIYLLNGIRLNVTGALTEGASVSVAMENDWGAFTNGYSTHNGSADPAQYFKSTQGYKVSLKNGEAELLLDTSYGETDYEKPFVTRKDQVNVDTESLSSVNWMSGVSGENYLNEINIPGSHDSGMNNVMTLGSHGILIGSDYTNGLSWLAPSTGRKFAKTQKEYINQTLEEGARELDIRLNDRYKWDNYSFGWSYKDDGKNLWLCHGKAGGGTYFAWDENNDYLSLKQVLDWVKEFLRKHPTETIMLDLRPETEQAGHIDNIYRRARKILENEALAINPSTGEPYLYKEPGSKSYFAPYTHMPQLKDCRGKIVLEPYDDAFVRQVGGFTLDDAKNKFDLDYQDKCDYKGLSTDMVANVTKWYNTFNGDGSVKVPTDANTRCDHLWYWELNCTGQCMGDVKNYTFWGEAPHILAEYVNPALVGEGKTFAPEKAGQYIGWVRMDSYEAQYGEVIWRTNFADNAEYCTVTVKSGLDSENYPDQTYKLAKGSSITIPGNIYKQLSGKYLSGWTAQGDNTNEICAPNETFKVNEDITFTAQWLDEGQIPVRIEWKDGDDADKLRAGSVDLNVTDGSGTNTVTLTSKDNWQTVMTATGEVSGIVPNWNKITVTAENPLGTDTVGEYRYTRELVEGDGYVFTFYHTPQTRTQISGTVEWDDEGHENQRPASVTVKLLANGAETNQSVTVTADTNWRFEFVDVTEYENGEKIVYTISENDVEGYTSLIDGYTVTNTYSAYNDSLVEAVGIVEWDDADNAKGVRPQTVTVHLLNNGEEVESYTFDEGEDGYWSFNFGAIPIADRANYTITADNIEGYTVDVINTDSPMFQIAYTLVVDEEEKVPAELEEAPTALDLTYTGEAQTLIEAGKATGGTIMYALGTDENTAPVSGYSEELPTGTEVGTYYVWYYVDGDALHTDTEKQCLTVNIANHYFMRHSLSLNGDIGVNFYLKLTEAEINSGAEVEFELNGEVISTYTINKTRDANTIDGMTLYKASCKVCAPEMADTITATLTIGGSNVETDTYSAKQYADVILSSDYEEKFLAKEGNTEDDYAELATLVQTMLNYGAATQEQFVDEHPDNTVMANDDIDYDLVPLTSAELSALDLTIPDKEAINAHLAGTGLTYYGYTMLLHSETKLRFYFQKADPDTDITGIHLSITAGQNTVTYNAQNYNKKYAYVEVPAIPAYELNNVYTLTVGDKNLGSYSALTYVKDVLTDNELASDDPLVATATAMYRYHKAAVIWFSSHSNS